MVHRILSRIGAAAGVLLHLNQSYQHDFDEKVDPKRNSNTGRDCVGLPILENVNTAEGRRQRVSMTKKTDHTPFSQCDIPHGNTFQQRRSII